MLKRYGTVWSLTWQNISFNRWSSGLEAKHNAEHPGSRWRGCCGQCRGFVCLSSPSGSPLGLFSLCSRVRHWPRENYSAVVTCFYEVLVPHYNTISVLSDEVLISKNFTVFILVHQGVTKIRVAACLVSKCHYVTGHLSGPLGFPCTYVNVMLCLLLLNPPIFSLFVLKKILYLRKPLVK